MITGIIGETERYLTTDYNVVKKIDVIVTDMLKQAGAPHPHLQDAGHPDHAKVKI